MPPASLPIYLASRSPRRRELLTQIGIPFVPLLFRTGTRSDAEVDETPLPGEAPSIYVARVAAAKADFARQLLQLRRLPDRPLLSADTTLDLDGQIIGKPDDARDATRILERLSGREHAVLTAVALNAAGQTRVVVQTSRVRFAPLSTAVIAHYVASGEPLDKAGAYGIQGRAGAFISELSGSYSGVMGLPLFETSQLLAQAGVIPS